MTDSALQSLIRQASADRLLKIFAAPFVLMSAQIIQMILMRSHFTANLQDSTVLKERVHMDIISENIFHVIRLSPYFTN